ncbi:MAG: VOC family protein [Actinomycetota bacterium]|nr:VOC family protein [Actinomycetota bacterium]
MTAKPKFAHVVYQTGQPDAMRDWYCTVLDGHVVFENEALTFVTFDEEHHRVAFLTPPVPLEPKKPTTAAMHHTAYTFPHIDDLLERYQLLRDKDITPAVCIAHGVTTSMYYRDPDGNMVEMQVDAFADPDEATAYMRGPEYGADAVGPQFDPEEILRRRMDGASPEELSGRAWCVDSGLPDPLPVLIGAP